MRPIDFDTFKDTFLEDSEIQNTNDLERFLSAFWKQFEWSESISPEMLLKITKRIKDESLQNLITHACDRTLTILDKQWDSSDEESIQAWLDDLSEQLQEQYRQTLGKVQRALLKVAVEQKLTSFKDIEEVTIDGVTYPIDVLKRFFTKREYALGRLVWNLINKIHTFECKILEELPESEQIRIYEDHIHTKWKQIKKQDFVKNRIARVQEEGVIEMADLSDWFSIYRFEESVDLVRSKYNLSFKAYIEGLDPMLEGKCLSKKQTSKPRKRIDPEWTKPWYRHLEVTGEDVNGSQTPNNGLSDE